MKTIWREKRALVIAYLASLGLAVVSGSLAVALFFGVESLIGLALWLVFGGLVIIELSLLMSGVALSLSSGRLVAGRRSRAPLGINFHTGERTDDPIDIAGFGRGS